jgi:hypothetical protein
MGCAAFFFGLRDLAWIRLAVANCRCSTAGRVLDAIPGIETPRRPRARLHVVRRASNARLARSDPLARPRKTKKDSSPLRARPWFTGSLAGGGGHTRTRCAEWDQYGRAAGAFGTVRGKRWPGRVPRTTMSKGCAACPPLLDDRRNRSAVRGSIRLLPGSRLSAPARGPSPLPDPFRDPGAQRTSREHRVQRTDNKKRGRQSRPPRSCLKRSSIRTSAAGGRCRGTRRR